MHFPVQMYLISMFFFLYFLSTISFNLPNITCKHWLLVSKRFDFNLSRWLLTIKTSTSFVVTAFVSENSHVWKSTTLLDGKVVRQDAHMRVCVRAFVCSHHVHYQRAPQHVYLLMQKINVWKHQVVLVELLKEFR